MLDVLQRKPWMFKGDLVLKSFVVFGHLYIFYLKRINVMNFPKNFRNVDKCALFENYTFIIPR